MASMVTAYRIIKESFMRNAANKTQHDITDKKTVIDTNNEGKSDKIEIDAFQSPINIDKDIYNINFDELFNYVKNLNTLK